MTLLNPSPIAPNPPKPSKHSGCVLTIFAIAFAILGIYNLVFGSIIAYIFSSAGMFSPASITLVLIIACNCVIYFILALRIKRQRWFISLALLAVAWLVLPLPLLFLINTTTMRLRVDGYAMGATLPNGSYTLADKQVYQQNDPKRGDVVVFQSPVSPDSFTLIKRIIGLPGDVVSMNQGQVSINGALINEPYLSVKATYSGEWNIPQGEYFVLGDNRPDSSDSHLWGFVPRKNIMAKAVWVYFPLASFGKIIDFDTYP
jgi:signal peptidase I